MLLTASNGIGLLWGLAILALVVGLVFVLTHWTRPLIGVVHPTRAPFLTLLAGVGILFLAGQGREVMEGLTAAPGWHLFWFTLAIAYWAFQCWHWSRVSLYVAYGTDRTEWGEREWLVTNLPRIYGLAVHAMALAAILWAAWSAGLGWKSVLLLLILVGASATAFLLFVLFRLQFVAKLGVWMHNFLSPRLVERTLATSRIEKSAGWRTALARMAPLSHAVLIVSLLIFVWNIMRGGWWPVEAGQRLGAAAIAFGALGTWVSILSILAILGRLFRFPVLASLIVAMLVMSWIYDENVVRTDPASEQAWRDGKDPRPTLAQAVQTWRDSIPADAPGPIPVVMVATAGGGLRAAYWTGTALTELSKRYEGFDDRLVAISGVSGGSVGAVVYTAALAEIRRGELPLEKLQTVVQSVLRRDFLAPTLSAMFYTDAIAELITEPLKFGGRAAALENSWSAAWDADVRETKRVRADGSWSNPLAQPFLKLWDDAEKGWRPILLLNATHEQRGKRVIASNVRVTQAPFADAWDIHALLQRDMWTVTAAHNSARFTFVSPPGMLRERNAPGQGRGHVLDGGYFENYGATTLLQALGAILDQLDPARFVPVVIQISSDPALNGSSDPTLGSRDLVLGGVCGIGGGTLPFLPEDTRSPWTLANEILGPVGGLLATREARGLLATHELARAIDCRRREGERPGVFIHLAMCGMEKRKPPLGWVMDQRSRDDIGKLMDENGCNGSQLAELDKVLRRRTAPPALTAQTTQPMLANPKAPGAPTAR